MIQYKIVKFDIEFENPLLFKVYPSFIFRSVLGKELKRMACIFKGSVCSECSLKYTCVYSYMFESPVNKDNPIIYGRNFVSHPFLLWSENVLGRKVKRIVLEVLLIGKGIEYLPYIYFAFLKAGEIGIFKERNKYRINDVLTSEGSIMQSKEKIKMNFERDEWFLDDASNINASSVSVYLLSPYRVKYGGKYGTDFSAIDFFNSVKRRMVILGKFYGNLKEEEIIYAAFGGKYKIFEKNMYWYDLNYYSARQGQRLKLGGVLGNFAIEGRLGPMEISLLKGAEIFHIGKNPSFGLGKIKVEIGK